MDDQPNRSPDEVTVTEHVIKGTDDTSDTGQSSVALQNLLEYTNNPSNHLKKYEEEVTRLLQTVSEEFEQIAVRGKTELDQKIADFQKRLSVSETNRERYRNERNNWRKKFETLYKERNQTISTEEELQLKREIIELKNTYDRREREWTRRLRDAEESSDGIIRRQKRELEQTETDIKLRDTKIANLEEELEKSRSDVNVKEELNTRLENDQRLLRETSDGLHHVPADLDQSGKELADHKTGNKERNQKLNQTEKELNEAETGNEERNQKFSVDQEVQLKREIEELRSQNIYTEEELLLKREIIELKSTFDQRERDWAKRLRDSEETSDRIIRRQKQELDQIEKDIKLRDTKIVTLEKASEERRYGLNDTREHNDKLECYQIQLDETNERLHQASTKFEQTEKEHKDTNTGLSKTISEKSTDTNPEKADDNRQENIVEKYAALYDNHWTDAFEEIERYFEREEDVIYALLEILQDVMAFCKDNAKRQMEDLHRDLTFSDYQVEKGIPENITKQLNDSRKAVFAVSVENLYKLYLASLQKTTKANLRHAMEIDSFLKDCFEMCWLMAIQDPPIVFSPISRKVEALNTDKYKPYKSSGRFIKFVVWPALLLHEDGPVLAKGVAQGMSDKREKQSKLAWAGNTGKTHVTMDDFDLVDKHHIATDHAIYLSGQDRGKYKFVNEHYEYPRPGNIQQFRSVSLDETGSSYAQSTIATKTIGIGAGVIKPSQKYGRDPTREEMRLFFRYADRREYSKAVNALGYDTYIKCHRNEHKRHLYC